MPKQLYIIVLGNDENKQNKGNIKMTLVNLESVGTVLDTDNGMTFPMNDDGTPDLNNPVWLEDCCEFWFAKLFFEDKVTVTTVH